jgi:Raf kinase inhibitor-like YbhB/YbcL family protein
MMKARAGRRRHGPFRAAFLAVQETRMPLNIKDLKIESTDFEPLGRMKDVQAADKGNVAPRLKISGVPQDAVELAMICHDPDAPLAHGFTHWTVYGIPPETTELHGESKFRVGPNSLGENAYFGPQPPAGHGLHHYYFWIYALNTKVEGAPSREQFLERYAGNIIEQNRVIGVYSN